MNATIRVGNAQAFWGDSPSAAIDLLTREPELDYLTMDYLAEVSMSILALQRERDPNAGYPQDFVEVVRQLVPYWNAGGKCKLIANAGGLNPIGCALACKQAIENAGCRPLRIGIVHGDDVLPLLKSTEPLPDLLPFFNNLDTGREIESVASRLATANAYTGCHGMVRALQGDADIVITGRVADPSMVVAACVHAFGWPLDAWNKLAGATVAGHLLECGTHVTGGISTDWLDLSDASHIGFPIAEIDAQGQCVVTKTASAGGRVSISTVKEQLIYEIGNPDRYLSPDVTVSFLGLQVGQIGDNQVRVQGAIGAAPPRTLKVSATYRDGFRAAGTLTIVGPNAVRKATRCGHIVLQRLKEKGHTFRDTIVECLGNADGLPNAARLWNEDLLFEVALRVAVEADARDAVEAFSRELIPLVTAGPQGTTGYAEGRPRCHPVYRYWPCLIPAESVACHVEWMESISPIADRGVVAEPHPTHTVPKPSPSDHPNESLRDRESSLIDSPSLRSLTMDRTIPSIARMEGLISDHVHLHNGCRLIDFAYGRSGDKGIHANVGVLVRASHHYEWLTRWLTAQRVHEYFRALDVNTVERFEMPNLGGLNFVLHGILKRSIRNDAQGKALAQLLLAMPVEMPP
jgi:hypothetical protein